MDLIGMDRETNLLRVHPEARVEYESSDVVQVSLGAEVLTFDLAAPVYQEVESGRRFVAQLREVADRQSREDR